MKKLLLICSSMFLLCFAFSQEVLRIQNGGSLTIQNGTSLNLQGGLTLDYGSSLLNNGTLVLKNNVVSNSSNWTDNSILGALTGTGIVIFNSTHPQQITGPTSFYAVYINTDQLTINNDLNISNLLGLIKGKINTGNYVLALINTAASSLENDVSNEGYVNSWVNGNFRRSIATNTNNYDFPVGNSERNNLLKFINNNITGPSSLTASFEPKPGTDAGLNVVENGNTYTAVNNGGVWKLVPNSPAITGNYALHLYFNGFTGLLDNSFGILRRPDASTNATDWIVPTGSLLEPLNGTGRKVSDGFARRFNISDFSQLGIGQFSAATACEITGQSAVCIGSINNIFSAPAGMTTYFWSVTGAGIVGSNTEQTVNISVPNAPGTFTVNLMTTLNGVPAQCSKLVTISPTPTCEIAGPNQLCAASINNTYSGPANMFSYSWTASPGLMIVGSNTGSSVNITAMAPGPQLLTLIATGAGGCVSQCTKTINVNPVAPCSITGASNVTTGSANNQYTAPENMSSYSWSISGNGSIVGSTTGASVTVTAGAAGSYTLTLTTTLNGCSFSCNKMVTVSAPSTYSCDITGPSEVCNGLSGNMYTAPSDLSSYNWSVSGNGSIIGSATGASVNIAFASAGSFVVTLQTMLNGVSCSSQKIVTVTECVTACTYTQGFYGNVNGTACYNNSGNKFNASQLMLNAFGTNSSKVFGSIANKRFFTLFKSDISSGAIFKMLPGGGNSKPIDVDRSSPFDGAYHADEGTWSLVPLQPKGPRKGSIRNSLLAQTITLWFNLNNSTTLGAISLINDTLVTKKITSCGSNTSVGDAMKFGLPHEVILYLNGGNGYAPTVSGLFALANDVLGGINTGINTWAVSAAVDVINNAFDGCRVVVGSIPYSGQVLVSAQRMKTNQLSVVNTLKVMAYPNPYKDHFQLLITSPVTGLSKIEFFDVNGKKVYEMTRLLNAHQGTTVRYTAPAHFATLIYRVSIKGYAATGVVLQPN